MSKTVSNTTCVKCHNCGEYTNYADSVYHKEREAELAATKQKLEAAEAKLKELAEQEPIYAYRRRGRADYVTCDKERYDELAAIPNLFAVAKYYARPVPPPDLQKRIDELEAELMDGKVCDQCTDGDGWNYNAVEGRVPCVCMTEAEPYQLLQEELTGAARVQEMLENENAQLKKKLAEQQATVSAIRSHFAAELQAGFRSKGAEYVLDMLGLHKDTEELTALLSAARAEGVEEGGKLAVPEGWQLVPKEATANMCLTAEAEADANSNWRLIWDAMLAAAPTHKEE